MNDGHDELIQMHIDLMRHVTHLTNALQPQKRLLHKEVLLLNTSAAAQFTVRLPFAARWINVINQTAAMLYLADGEPGPQPNDAIPVPPYTVQTVALDDVQILSVYQGGAATSGANALVLQASTDVFPSGATNQAVQAQLVGNNVPQANPIPRLLATTPYTAVSTTTAWFVRASGLLSRNAISRTFIWANSLNIALSSADMWFYDSTLPDEPSDGGNTAITTGAIAANAQTIQAQNNYLGIDSCVTNFSAVTTAPTSGNLYLYVVETLS